MDEKIEKYILDIIFATRYPEKYKLAEFETINQFWMLRHVEVSIWQMLQNVTLLSNVVDM